MIDRLILRPILRVTTWVKRHPFLAFLLLLFLFVLPPFVFFLYLIAKTVVDLVSRFLGIRAGIFVATAAMKFLRWVEAKPWRCAWIAFAVSLIFPLLGFSIGAWCFLDQFKPKRDTTQLDVSPSPSPEPTPSPAPETGSTNEPPEVITGIDDVFEEIFSGSV
jgi:hypothetical protein